jgi:cystinosin
MQNDWTGITGNPVKFGLGNITLVFDLIFFFQHYVLYRDKEKQVEDDEVDAGEWIPERERLVSG